MKKTITRLFLFIVMALFSITMMADDGKNTTVTVLFDSARTPIGSVIRQDVTAKSADDAFDITTGLENNWPGIQLNGNWNLENHLEMTIMVTNDDTREISLHCRLDSTGASDNMRNTHTASITIASGETKRWKYKIPQQVPEELKDRFFAMRGTPFGMNPRSDSTFDPSSIRELRLFVNQSKRIQHWRIKRIVAEPTEAASYVNIPAADFFPMIDSYGQFMHKDWPGKIHTQADFATAIKEEQSDLATNPSPKDRNRYGGWTAEPKQEASGHFYPKKVDGKWWLVDPEGCLFWSHGTDCLTTGNAVTPITDREFYFAEIPDRNGEFAACHGTGNWAPHNYYEGRGEYKTFDFSKANLMRKYGGDWQKNYGELVHKRLKSWGMNTIANWSSAEFYRMRKTPYTETLNINAQPIRGSDGYWGKFIDPFDLEFCESLRHSAERAARFSGNDPWCIGYFVQNEISWGDETSLSNAMMMSPADQPGKIVMVAWLKEKYGAIEKLNATWGTNHADWDALLASTEKPDAKKAKDDLLACYSLIAEQYFRVISEELKRICPHKLYLGCRFAWGNDLATRAAGKYCDIISFNRYQYQLDDFVLPDGLDKPCIIGEFHFGALDRGMFHTGLCPTASQEARAAAYEKYVTSALKNPLLVGTHWFQYMDQATTGRGDGENYQIGLVDSCDTPYAETIEAVRKIGNGMYEIRKNGL